MRLRDALSPEHGPLRPPGNVARTLPFAAVAVVATAVIAVGHITEPGLFGASLIVLAAVIVGAVVTPWKDLPVAFQAVVPFVFLPVIGLLRAGTGGTFSSAGVLVLLPVCWVGLYHRKVAIGVILASSAALFVVPVVLVGGATYPDSDLRRSAAIVLVGLLVASIVHVTIQELNSDCSSAEANVKHLTAITLFIRGLQREADPRRALCEGILGLTGACLVQLFEPGDDHDGPGTMTACARYPESPPCDDDENQGGATEVRRVFRTGKQLFRGDASATTGTLGDLPAFARTPHSNGSNGSYLCAPVRGNGEVLAVLMVEWAQRVRRSDPVVAVVDTIADEAVGALQRSGVFARLDHESRTDGLTGLANRRAWDETLLRALGGLTPGDTLCVALLDLDHFKRYNDQYGHVAGDELLAEAATAWRGQLRAVDTVARHGGEEFALALPACKLDQASAVIGALLEATPKAQTASAGVTEVRVGETPQAVMLRVDEALYEAKGRGRNQVWVADPPHVAAPDPT